MSFWEGHVALNTENEFLPLTQSLAIAEHWRSLAHQRSLEWRWVVLIMSTATTADVEKLHRFGTSRLPLYSYITKAASKKSNP